MSSHVSGTNFEEAFNETGHGKFNILVLLICGFILLYATTECLSVAYLLERAECDLQLSATERGWIAGSTFLGVVSTAMFWGYLGDAYGRRRVMLPALLATVSASVCSSLAVNFWNMFILRLVTGALVSASIATVYAFLGEMVLASKRAKCVSWTSAFIAFAFITMPGMAWFIFPLQFSIHAAGLLTIVPWRVFVWAGCAWGLLAALGLLVLPESPRYLLASRGPAAVLPVLAKMYAWNHNKKKSDYPVSSIAAAPAQAPSLRASLARLRHMVRPPLLRCVLISHTCIFLLFMQTNAFYVWMPHIINTLLNYNTSRVSMCDVMKAKYSTEQGNKGVEKSCDSSVIDSRMYPISMAMGVLTAATYVAIGYMVGAWGNKKVYCGLVIFCSGLTLASGLVPHAHAAIGLLIPGLCGGAATSVLVTVAIDVFPTSLRALALCTLFMLARLGAALGSNVLGLLLHQQCLLATTGFTALTAASTLLILLWPDAAKIRATMEARNFTY